MYNPSVRELMERLYQLNPELAAYIEPFNYKDPKTMADMTIPEGWEPLNPGDEIAKGDMYFSTSGAWEEATVAIGFPVLDNGVQFVRPTRSQ